MYFFVSEVQHSLPSYTSSISSFPNFYFSYPSYSSIPVKTVDHHVHVKVPQPYPVPITKHVTYPVPVPHPVEVPKPYYVRVAQPVPVTVNRPYAVEVPRAVPYSVPHYVRTNVPVVQQQPIDVKASNPVEGFFENAQSTFQNVAGNLPFQNPLEGFQNQIQGFQNPFQDFQNPFQGVQNPFGGSEGFQNIFAQLPFLPSFTPQTTQPPAPAQVNNVPTANSADSIAIENPTLNAETTDTKTVVAQPAVTHYAKLHQTTQPTFKPTTTCAGCSVSATHTTAKQEHVKSNGDANGGYNY